MSELPTPTKPGNLPISVSLQEEEKRLQRGKDYYDYYFFEQNPHTQMRKEKNPLAASQLIRERLELPTWQPRPLEGKPPPGPAPLRAPQLVAKGPLKTRRKLQNPSLPYNSPRVLITHGGFSLQDKPLPMSVQKDAEQLAERAASYPFQVLPFGCRLHRPPWLEAAKDGDFPGRSLKLVGVLHSESQPFSQRGRETTLPPP
ncbi:hypothetical protein E2320_013664 [Naja naja]|nr:hypothetical protein E2320_013664 [Naja naja]